MAARRDGASGARRASRWSTRRYPVPPKRGPKGVASRGRRISQFHDLRHEATSHLAAVLSVHELAKVTGHQDLRMLIDAV